MKILTFNIHKGFTMLNRRYMLKELRERIREEGADLVFLQEATGDSQMESSPGRIATQYEYLADGVWKDFAYGKNAVTERGHHGNAILSRFPILRSENIDISTNEFEQRGALLCEIENPKTKHKFFAICTHLSLYGRGRRKQFRMLREIIELRVPKGAPLVIAGDFNDWSDAARLQLEKPERLTEVFRHEHGQIARTFPALFPVLRLDRIYVRALRVRAAEILDGPAYRHLSDHTALGAELAWS